MFELTEVRYLQGAPMEWRRVLTPGTWVVLHFEEAGLRVVAEAETFNLPWTTVEYLSARGPDVPEQRFDDSLWHAVLRGSLLGHMIKMSAPFERFCWFAVGVERGQEIIFEVEQMLRPALERALDEHSR
jgi:hypothetical protein